MSKQRAYPAHTKNRTTGKQSGHTGFAEHRIEADYECLTEVLLNASLCITVDPAHEADTNTWWKRHAEVVAGLSPAMRKISIYSSRVTYGFQKKKQNKGGNDRALQQRWGGQSRREWRRELYF